MYRFYGELTFALSKPIDLVSIDFHYELLKAIQQEGELLYSQLK